MKPLVIIAVFTALWSTISSATIIIPSFMGHPKERKLRGEQTYHEGKSDVIMWQLRYWSRNELHESALSQALSDVVSDSGKYTGLVTRGDDEFSYYHASAGKENKTATLFYINQDGVKRIVGIGRHVIVKPCKPPVYEIIGWDERFTISD